jgi:hypothetical protein
VVLRFVLKRKLRIGAASVSKNRAVDSQRVGCCNFVSFVCSSSPSQRQMQSERMSGKVDTSNSCSLLHTLLCCAQRSEEMRVEEEIVKKKDSIVHSQSFAKIANEIVSFVGH